MTKNSKDGKSATEPVTPAVGVIELTEAELEQRLLDAKVEAAAEIAGLDPAVFAEKFPTIANAIASRAIAGVKTGDMAPTLPKLKRVKGVHVLEIAAGDPFIDGVVRTYLKASNDKPRIVNVTARPLELSSDDKAVGETLKSYRLRADAAGDKARVEIIDRMMAQCK